MHNLPQHPGDEILKHIDEHYLIVWATGEIFSKKVNRFIGTKSNGCAIHDGYARVVIKGKYLKYHHVVWYMTRRFWPDLQVDHVSGNKYDQRPINLELVTDAENQRRRSIFLNQKKV